MEFRLAVEEQRAEIREECRLIIKSNDMPIPVCDDWQAEILPNRFTVKIYTT